MTDGKIEHAIDAMTHDKLEFKQAIDAIRCTFSHQNYLGTWYCRKDPSTLCDGLKADRLNCPHWSALVNPP